jgi:multiple sugar transport system substrate-binding protein
MLVIASMVMAACAPKPTPTSTPVPTKAPVPTQAPQPTATTPKPTATPQPAERVEIRWFVGLGTGSEPEQMPAQEELVKKFNESQNKITLVIELVDYDQSSDQLKTEVASGNPPDIIGPVGQTGVNEFEGLFLDLQPLVDAAKYDMSDLDTGTLDLYRIAGEGLVGIPIAIYPSMIFYNRDLFDEAKIPYPPHKYGEKYADGDAWTVDKLEEIAMKLTVDANGNDATSSKFDPDNIVQFGYLAQWNDPVGEWAALFGAGSLVDKDGNAVMPALWRRGIIWNYEGMHKKHFIPNQSYQDSDLLAAGNPFDSGNLAMAHTHLWYTCCMETVPNWDLAAIPAYDDKGNLAVEIDADTFRILKSTKHPKEAFEVLTWILGDASAELLKVYDGMPARKSQQKAYLDELSQQFTQGVDWQVGLDGLKYPDIPNHEGNMPNWSKSYDLTNALATLYRADPNLDINAEIDKLLADLQVTFHEKQ